MSEIPVPEAVASKELQTTHHTDTLPERGRETSRGEKILDTLKEKGYVEQTSTGDIIVDVAKFRERGGWRADQVSQRGFGDEGLRLTRAEALIDTFKDRLVTSKDDWAQYLRARDQGQRVELPKKLLYYSPKTKEEALDPERIRQADFYLGPWEANSTRPNKYPGLENTDLTYAEVATAALIYHPQFGAGERDSGGTLFVNYPTSGERRPISSEFFKKETRFSGKSSGSVGFGQPRAYVAQDLRHLVEANLLRGEDFRITSTSATAEKYRVEKKVSPSGTVMLNRLVHNVGGKTYKGMSVYELTPQIGAVVSNDQGKLELKGTFRILNKLELPLGSSLGMNETKPQAFNPSKEPQTDLEKIAANFSSFLSVSNNFSRDYGINISDLNLSEQLQSQRVYENISSSNEFKRFVSRHGEAGLKTLITMSDSDEKVRALYRLGQEPHSSEVFAEFNQLRSLLSNFAEKTSGTDTNRQRRIINAALSRSEQILFADLRKIGKNNQDKVSELRSYSERTKTFLEQQFDFRPEVADKEQNLKLLEAQTDPNLAGFLETSFERIFDQEKAQQRGSNLAEVTEQTKDFYNKTGEKLFVEASETTGDTELEINRLEAFLGGFGVKGKILDAGSADGKRVTEPIAAKHTESSFIGLDLDPEGAESSENSNYIKGSFTHIPVANESLDAIYSVWSPINDITRREDQQAFIKEFGRTVKPGGYVFIDVPYLSSQLEGSWYSQAVEYSKQADVPFGMIQAAFQTGDGQIASKEFYIYLETELQKLLSDVGFERLNQTRETHIDQAVALEKELKTSKYEQQTKQNSPIANPIWLTKSGKPRLTIIARKTNKLGTNLDLIG